MTDNFDDKQKEVRSFKEKILEDIKKANEQREAALAAAKAREEELKLAIAEAELEARRREEELKLAEEAKRREEELTKALKEAEEKEKALRLQAEENARLERLKEEAQERAQEEERKLALEEARRVEVERQAQKVAEKIAQAQKIREEAYKKAASEQASQKSDSFSDKETAFKKEEDSLFSEVSSDLAETPQQVTKASLASVLAQENLSKNTISSTEEFVEEQVLSETSDQVNEAGLVENISVEEPQFVEEPELEELVIDIDHLDDQSENQALMPSNDDREEGLVDTTTMRKRKTNVIAMRISAILVTIIVLLTLATAFVGYRYISTSLAPVNSKSTEYVQIEVPEGAGNKLIGNILEEAGLIKSSSVFNYYTKFKNFANFKSGYYNLQPNMSVEEIAKELQKGGTSEPVSPALGKVRITEGYTIKQIAASISNNVNTKTTSDKTPFTSEEFLNLIQDDSFIASMVEKYPQLLGSLPSKSDVKYQLEGYLYPATYDYYEDTTLEDLVEQMIAAMDTNLDPYYNSISKQNMTVNEVLTLSSLVEKEGSSDEDRQKIAAVFNNRLAQNMPLQSNIAILYAMDKLGEKTTLTEDATIDTSIDSPYNIYVNTGLMPGPVDSPSLSAIKAVITPAETNDLYFVADVTTGKVYFAEDYETHSANVEKYVNSKLTTSSSSN